MPNTTNGVPYPAGTTALSTWAATMLALAQFVDDRLNTRCVVWQNVAQAALATGVGAIVTFDSEETDAKGLHNPAVNPSRITISTQGRYEIKGQVTFAANATGYRSVSIYKNGAPWAANRVQAAGTLPCQIQVVRSLFLVPGDYIELQAAQASGGALAISTGQVNTFLDVTLTGAA